MAHALCSSTQLLSVTKSVCKGGRHGGGGGGESQQAVLIERSVLVCKFCGRGSSGGGLVAAQGHMVLLEEEKGSFPRNTCQVSHEQVTWLLRRHLQMALNVVRCFFFFFKKKHFYDLFLFLHFKIKALQQLLSVSDMTVTHLE